MDKEHFDAIVIGSGFGGSVMAYRLAEAGHRVCLLERGKAYPPGSFPRSPHGMRDNFWIPGEGRFGLFDFWSFHRIHALVASGLGGGSLIYANVLMRKDEKWFVQEDLEQGGYEHWPITRFDLDPHYDAVERMLRPQRYPFDREPYSSTSKTKAFADAARGLGLEPFLPGLAVTFANDGQAPVPGEPIRDEYPNLHGRIRQTCRLCGECDFGCNFGSKNTLDFNYLSAAKRHGAELRTGCEVKAFEPRREGGYAVRYLEHPISGPNEDRESRAHTITANRLILAAGTIGSTSLLLRNRSAFPGISPMLGTRFCGNGDLLAFAIRATEEVDGKRVPRVIDPGHGPVITSAVRVADEADGGEGRGFYLEDAGFPEHIAWLLHMFAMPRPIGRMIRRRFIWDWWGKGPDPNLGSQLSEVFGNTGLSTGVLPMLGMGRDIPNGNMKLRAGRLAVDWKRRKSGAYFDRVRRVSKDLAQELGARYMDDPLWYLNRLITVHPLGGCPMGRNVKEGVVDSRGEVFGYPGLFIADGSIMPGPVGANPSLTIAAVADRIADGILEPGSGTAP
ncbi:MAG: Glucose-methanol-choline (GMC) oxidoreductase:NAD binding site [uncultured Thermomicrobiales bacterium]|uniref:Cholesterol oxidase n=1 Tax=uncultured Thermomicrobiales bacterium TaxID=1645740 RepID=A0A6J4UJ84_9BACT|nr:MAG: Glucose-methanol-choline (GMC) oxidoreductase:NAD binding site [uncultured Thermomicrobiales bacterium]